MLVYATREIDRDAVCFWDGQKEKPYLSCGLWMVTSKGSFVADLDTDYAKSINIELYPGEGPVLYDIPNAIKI